MHELSIAVSLVEIAVEQIERLALGAVEAVHLKLGRLAGVVPDALLFSFGVATEGTVLEGTRLEIQHMPVVVRCTQCNAERELTTMQRMRCPVCDAPTPHILRGREIELFALEVRSDVRDQPSTGGSARGSAPEERPPGS